MRETAHQERILPSLLDRLTDDNPTAKTEGRGRRAFSLDRLRRAVVRDLIWLFNTGNLHSVHDLDNLPDVGGSVINYGLPDLAGTSAAGVDQKTIETLIKKAITDFEPRILRKTLKVRLVLDEAKMSRNSMILEIHGQLWAEPIPLELYLKTEVDLETGNVTVSEYDRQR